MSRACSAASMWAWRLSVRTASSSAARLGKRRYRVAMPTPAWRAICSRGASRPWSQNACRAASTMASRLRWASRRSGRGAGRLEAVLVQDAARIQMMGLPVLEALPARGVPYQRVDPFLRVHESRLRLSELSGLDTRHPHRGFDNLWYILEGSASTGHSTGPGGAIERARLPKGALLALRTGRGAWHAEAIGAEERTEGLGDTEWRKGVFLGK